jgi:hypothetical protein
MDFIKQSRENLENVKKEEIEILYGSLYPEIPCALYLDGEPGGRSLQGLKIGTNDLGHLFEKIKVNYVGGSHSPGRNIVEAFQNLERVYDKCNYLCVSGSGSSITPYKNLKELTEKHKSKKLTLNLITSYIDSPMGEIIQEYNGNILELKGRKSKSSIGADYIKEGLLEDEFELETTELASIITRGILEEIEPEDFYDYYRDKLKELDETNRMIEDLKKTPEYELFLEYLFSPAKNFFSCGQEVSNEIVKMNNTRIGHLRPLTAERVGMKPDSNSGIGANRNVVVGESNIRDMDENSVLLGVSQSGTGKIEKYLDDAKEVGAERFLVTKYGEEEEGINMLRLNTNNFYTDTCLLLSSSLMDLGYKLVEEGTEVSERILRAIHVGDKI